MQQTYERIDHEAEPPADVMPRWADQAVRPPEEADARRWLDDALDREGHFADTHPTLRARLRALQTRGEVSLAPPPALSDRSAARVWLGPLLERLRGELQTRWTAEVAQPWAEQHADAQRLRERLVELRTLEQRNADQQLEMLRLSLRLDKAVDLREDFAAFNAAHGDHVLGLYLEGVCRLDRGDRAGLSLFERVMALDPETTKPACERAHAFLAEQKDSAQAEVWAERWRQRDEMERLRTAQMQNVDAGDELLPHGLDAVTLDAVRALLSKPMRKDVAEVYLARRNIPVDPSVRQFMLGVRLTWWGRRRGKQSEVVNRLAALQWPVSLVVVSLGGTYAPLRKKSKRLPDAALTF